ncbi:MAG TPA: CHRD domain-containing protein [Acidimicrobiales bacterium]|nr:CHRD domain-containing protein [Acidimicrobiales bacterium]
MRRVLGPLLLIALVVAACGGDDDDTAPSTTTAAPAEDDGGEAAQDDGDPDVTTSTTQASTTTDAADAPAGDGPDAGSADEGLGDVLLVADLTPDAEVPGPGDPEAAGRFEAELVEGVLCVDVDVAGLSAEVTGAHIHDGATGAAGPVLVDLGAPGETIGGEARWRDACTEVSDEVIERLAGAPDQHYVNVHTGAHPDGAVRGQLLVASVFDRTLE